MVESLQNAFLLFAGGLFALLALSIFVSGILLPRMDSYASQGIFRFDARVMLFVNFVLAAIFLARAILNALTALQRINGITIPVTSADDASVWAFLLMTLFEVMPTSLLLATIARLPSSPGLFGKRLPATALLRSRPAPSGGYDAAVHPQPTILFGSSDGDSSGPLTPDGDGLDDNWPTDGGGGGGGIYDNARRCVIARRGYSGGEPNALTRPYFPRVPGTIRTTQTMMAFLTRAWAVSAGAASAVACREPRSRAAAPLRPACFPSTPTSTRSTRGPSPASPAPAPPAATTWSAAGRGVEEQM